MAEEKKIKILTLDEIKENWDELDHDECCLYQDIMDIEFLKEHHDEINWANLSVNPHITLAIIDAFSNDISWSSICINKKKIADVILANYPTKIKWTILLQHQQLDLRLLVFLSEFFRKSKSPNTEDFWNGVSRYQKFDVEYVDGYKRFINWKLIAHNKHLDSKTIDKYCLKMDPKVLLKNYTIDREILMNHREYFESAM